MGRMLLISWVSNVAALFVASWALSGVTYGDEWWTLLIAAAVFTVVNAWIKPIVAVLSIPFIVVTLGLFYFLINVLMLYVTDWVVPDFEISTFWWGVLAAIIVSIVNGLLHPLLPDPRERRPAAARLTYLERRLAPPCRCGPRRASSGSHHGLSGCRHRPREPGSVAREHLGAAAWAAPCAALSSAPRPRGSTSWWRR